MPQHARAELLERFQRAQAQVTDRIDAVEPGQWDAPALPGWTVADLVAHLTSMQLAAAALLAGGPDDDRPAATDAVLGDDPLTAWETAADAALTAWALETDPDRVLPLSGGPRDATEHLVAMTADITVHAWDVAHAVGGDVLLDAELVAAALRYGETTFGEDGVPGRVGPPLPVPAGADPLTRLLARFGRTS